MKKIGIIIAGGVGTRMGLSIPKQFIDVDGKPVIIYTLEAFQNHPHIDSIIVVCVDGWHEVLLSYVKKYNITKLESIVSGGKTGQESIKNGLDEARRLGYDDNDIVLIHDAIRPMVSQEILSDNIVKCETFGNATTVAPCTTVVLKKGNNDLYSTETVNREDLYLTQTPQAFKLGEILSAHAEAKEKGITGSLASCSLYAELGKRVYYSTGSETNIKLTRPGDVQIFKALLKTKKQILCDDISSKYDEILDQYSRYNLDWNQLRNKSIMISGVTGLVGKFFVDLIMKKNKNENLNCTVVGLCRDIDIAKEYFKNNTGSNLVLFQQDVSKEIMYNKRVDYVIHAASNTHPIQYATDPIGTIKTNVYGTNNLLEYSKNKRIEKFILLSSFEVYGKTDGISKIGENDYGIVNPITLRSCYPESKRLSENLTIAYSNQEDINVSIVRLSRVFGPTMQLSSSLATAQFIKNAATDQDITLKSDGTQLYSYNYVGDVATAILTVLLKGENREAYNVSDSNYDLSLGEFAKVVADCSGSQVIYDLPTEIEQKGFSNSTMTVMDSSKLKDLGWAPIGTLKEDVQKTVDLVKEKIYRKKPE